MEKKEIRKMAMAYLTKHKSNLYMLFNLRMVNVTGKLADNGPFGVWVYYKPTLWNPLVWLSVLIGIIYSMFDGGLINFFKDFPSCVIEERSFEVSKPFYNPINK